MNQSGVSDTSIYDYYLKDTPSAVPTDSEHEKVISELFADAVEVGAIVLPAQNETDNFRFTVSNNSDRVKVSLLERENIRPWLSILDSPGTAEDVTMGDAWAILETLHGAAASLLNKP